MSPVQISVPSLDELEHLRATVTATDSDEVLVDFQNKVDAALPALLKIARAATKLKAARYERHKRVRHLQALATEARRTGKPGWSTNSRTCSTSAT
jgi:hypothetical protein